MLEDAIKNFYREFTFAPTLENRERLPKRFEQVIVIGMGGSHLGADLIKCADPDLPLIVHHDYGLPKIPAPVLKKSLLIASSYSGNTEETLDAFEKARLRKLPLAAVSIGGELIARAKKYRLPYIQIPDTGVQPRSAIGFSIVAILALLKEKQTLKELKKLSSLKPAALESQGKKLAQKIKNAIPIIYASTVNDAVAQNWKIRLNETGKTPAFSNTLPEMNHNELISFEPKVKTKELGRRFFFILLKDENDHPRLKLRFQILKKFLHDWRFNHETLELKGKTRWERILNSLILADWTAYYMAMSYGLEPEAVDIIEKFKALLKKTRLHG